MFPTVNPTETKAWKKLEETIASKKSTNIKDLFAADADRFSSYSVQLENILFDYSKNNFDAETLALLIDLAKVCKLQDAIEAMFAAEKINKTEDRAVLHTALRNFSSMPVLLDGKDVMQEIQAVLAQMKSFCNNLHDRNWKGYTGKKIKYIVNIGIGGSDLGPVMVTET